MTNLDENSKLNVAPERQAYLKSLIATSRTNGYQLDEKDIAGLTEDEANFLDDLFFEEQLAASNEDGLSLARSVGVRTGVRGTIQRWLNRQKHQSHWEKKAEAANARHRALSGIHPTSKRDELQEKTFEATFPDFVNQISLGNQNIPPDEKSWGVITVNKNASVNDNIAFIKTHIENARGIKKGIEERLRSEGEKLNKNDHFKFQLYTLDRYEMEETLKKGTAMMDIETFIGRAIALAKILETNSDRLRHPTLNTKISIGFSPLTHSHFFFTDQYHIDIGIEQSDEEILTLIETITHADGPTKANEHTGKYISGAEVPAESELRYSIHLACAKIDQEKMSFLVSEGDNFTEPTEESKGNFSVAKGATRDEVATHIKTHMPDAIKLKDRAFRKAHPLIFPDDQPAENQ